MRFGVNSRANTPYPAITGVRKSYRGILFGNHESSFGDVETSYLNR